MIFLLLRKAFILLISFNRKIKSNISAELLANKVVPFFTLCSEQLSDQSHYDFGLRSLKSVLVMAGNVKRDKIKSIKDEMIAKLQVIEDSKLAEIIPEKEVNNLF